MRQRIILIVILCLSLVMASPAIASEAANGESFVQMRGSSTILDIMLALKKDLSASLSLHVHIEGGGSITGLEAVQDQKVDVAMVSRALSEEERKTLDYLTIAYDGVAVIVNRSNAVTRMTRQQIIDVFKGKVTSWKSLGNGDLPIMVLAKDQHRSTREVFDSYFGLRDRVRATRYVGSNTEMIVLVGTSPRAVGYVSIGSLQSGLSHGVPVRALELEEVAATVHNVATGAWPLRRELNLVWRRDRPPPKLAQLIEFMKSDRSREVIGAQHFIPLMKTSPGAQP